MQCQLILQFAADTLADYDALVGLENQLIETLGENTVDGHDMGFGEANIFILTPDPRKTFDLLAPILERTGHISHVTAASRRTDEDRYHILWPENSSRQFSVAQRPHLTQRCSRWLAGVWPARDKIIAMLRASFEKRGICPAK